MLHALSRHCCAQAAVQGGVHDDGGHGRAGTADGPSRAGHPASHAIRFGSGPARILWRGT
ncbi:hypothetical protein [Komagataeibacter kakiaceti]